MMCLRSSHLIPSSLPILLSLTRGVLPMWWRMLGMIFVGLRLGREKKIGTGISDKIESGFNSHFGFGVGVVLLIGAELPGASGGNIGRDEGALGLVRGRGSMGSMFGGYRHPGTKFNSGLLFAKAVVKV